MSRPMKWFLVAVLAAPVISYLIYRLAKGLGFLDPALICAYACLAMVFAGPVAAQSFEKKPASTMQAMGWIARAVAFGEGLSVAMLATPPELFRLKPVPWIVLTGEEVFGPYSKKPGFGGCDT